MGERERVVEGFSWAETDGQLTLRKTEAAIRRDKTFWAVILLACAGVGVGSAILGYVLFGFVGAAVVLLSDVGGLAMVFWFVRQTQQLTLLVFDRAADRFLVGDQPICGLSQIDGLVGTLGLVGDEVPSPAFLFDSPGSDGHSDYVLRGGPSVLLGEALARYFGMRVVDERTSFGRVHYCKWQR